MIRKGFSGPLSKIQRPNQSDYYVTLNESQTKDQEFAILNALVGGTGSVIVTSMAGVFMEGTLDARLNDHGRQRTASDGSFRFRMPPVEED